MFALSRSRTHVCKQSTYCPAIYKFSSCHCHTYCVNNFCSRNQLPSQPYLFPDKCASQKCMIYLLKTVIVIGSLINNVIPIAINKDSKIKLKPATRCVMCNQEFTLIISESSQSLSFYL